MLPQAKSQTEVAAYRKKLTNSYKQLLDEFSSPDLRHVGNYTLGRLLGKGSFGKVYLATHNLTNGSKVVLKSAKKNDQNLAREIHHHRQFTHPHIARLYEVIVTENLVWLVLEYCPGDELYNHLLQNGPIDPPKAQKLFTQLVGAVSYIHNKSCVHRDLKLENVLLDRHENVKLVDFGFTREYEGKSNYLQTWCGTVCYSAPEMLKGEKYAGEKVDVWSLGIILYALLAGELPFDDDDESITKARILKDEPVYPVSFPQQAKDLIAQLLSKRPLLRPSLADILQSPWLSEHAPNQQAILKVQQPAPFTTELEKETLHRMRSAGVDIDNVIENVLSQRCDALAGWWTLLIEKEERKAKRREQKRREREAEIKSIRRSSAASSRLERMAPTIREADEDDPKSVLLKDPPRPRGRPVKRLSANYNVPELPLLPETQAGQDNDTPPPPVEKDSVRSASSSRSRRPIPPPKENRRSRSSMLQVVQTNPELLGPNGYVPNRRRKHHPLLSQWASLRNWFKESAKRARSPNSKASSTTSPKLTQGTRPDSRTGSQTSQPHSQAPNPPGYTARSDANNRTAYHPRPRITTAISAGSSKRLSLSPSPLTPRSYRRSSAGLRGRKSTSSSISSIRSIHQHHPSHSKASSTSSASLASPSASKTPVRSPHASVKVLPATPTSSSFPANIRVVRASSNEASSAFGMVPPQSPGLLFAKRKKSPFKGPMLHLGGPHGSPHTRVRRGSGGGSRSGSRQGRRSGEIIEEEEEELEELGEDAEDGDDMGTEGEIEEVEVFSPVDPSKGETLVSLKDG